MKRVQWPRGNTAWNDAFIGEEGELTIDTQADEIRLHDGTTPGGKRIPNVGTIPTLSRAAITGTEPNHIDTSIDADDMDKMLYLANAGAYALPNRALLTIGTHVWICASVPGITITPFQPDQPIRDKGVSLTSRSLNQYEVVHLILTNLGSSSIAWHLVSSY